MRQASTPRRAGQNAPQTRAELEALTSQRGELQAQLRELSRRRNQLQEQWQVSGQEVGKGLQARIIEIDLRTARIDDAIQRLDDQISEGVGRGLATPEQGVRTISIPPINIPNLGRRPGIDPKLMAGAMAAEAFGFVLLGFVFWQFGWRRMRAQFTRALGDQAQRVEQVQQALDVIGVEVERISEGQRYVARVLTEGQAPKVLDSAVKLRDRS